MLKDLTGIIYDCDGVMIDSEDANRHFYNTILHAFGLPPMTREQENFAFMATTREALEAMLPRECLPRLEQVIQEVIDYPGDVLPRTRLMPGFREFIAEARRRGLRQGVDTNRTEEGISRVLDFFDLQNYFDPVVSASIAQPKPSPQGVLMICEKWACPPVQTLFVGDSSSDVQAGTAAGAQVAAFGKNNPVRDYRELTRMLWG